jgi:isoleucyl-tRNA synthetase
MTINYSKTVFLPKTPFAMKANLAQKEPEILKNWQDTNLGDQIDAQTKDKPAFILHDGPPYANGNMHIGHALNYILKDTVCRMKRMEGHYVPFINGSDCHGLPIEWKIEEKYRKQKKDKDGVPALEFRQECREFAAHWVEEQRKDLIRLGIDARPERSYTTMTPAAEAKIAEEIGKFLLNGSLYKGLRAVMWSPVEKTALADAEIEYHDHTSTTIYVRFAVVKTSLPELQDANIIIWTTTPWTIPGNRAICYGPDMDYGLYEVTATTEDSQAEVGEKFAVTPALLETVKADAGIEDVKELKMFKGSALEGSLCHHPFHGDGYDFEVPLLPGAHVTAEQGTGFVHTAPGHGEEDFLIGRQFDVEIACPVAEDGRYYDHIPLVGGVHVYKAAEPVCDLLKERGRLLSQGTLVHSYPHSWRSKAPLIFRATPQWFISMDTNDLRKKALEQIDQVRWIPERGRNRIYSMVESRPDWNISRQRVWGVPIPVFVHKESGEPLRDDTLMQRIIDIFKQEGSDAWFSSDASRFLGDDYAVDDYEQVFDIVDVWFESGSTHAFVMEERPELSWPADLYLEGSDQHRGWFQSSLLEAVGTRGTAPYKAVLTHGFVMDDKGRKMSKSLGNVIGPQEIIKQHGTDILRLWVVNSDYTQDLRIGNEIIQSNKDIYRRLRNTLRYLLGNLKDFSEDEKITDITQMPELERWVLHRLTDMDKAVAKARQSFDFHHMFTELHNFAANDLSAFYFDIRKDSLYCDRPDSLTRRACRTVLNHLFEALTSWLAPVLCFTMEEAWAHRPLPESGPASVHLRAFFESPENWRDEDLATKWQLIRRLRRVVNGALEEERAARNIGSSLESAPIIYATEEFHTALQGLDIAEICITSQATLKPYEEVANAYRLEEVSGVAVIHQKAEGQKCERCWKILPDVGQNPDYPTLSARDADAVAYFLSTAPEDMRALAMSA